MTHSPSHTSLAWREMVDALKLGEVACLSMMIFEPITSTQSKWEAASKIIKREREKLEVSSPPGTEPPQSINSELLEAAKETASFIRNCNGGSRGERINLDRLANLLEVAISNAEKAISIAKAEREMGEG